MQMFMVSGMSALLGEWKKKEEQKLTQATLTHARVLARNPAADPVYSEQLSDRGKKKDTTCSVMCSKYNLGLTGFGTHARTHRLVYSYIFLFPSFNLLNSNSRAAL